MGKPVIYIDGQSGTTGLQIRERLAKREDLELAIIPEEKRHDNEERKKYLNSADIVFFCLPDDAAREAAAMIENPAVRVIDASTAHRVAEGWDYGIPELSTQHRTRIKESKRVANPGCHATGFITSVYPLVAMGIIPKDLPLTVFSLTGYSFLSTVTPPQLPIFSFLPVSALYIVVFPLFGFPVNAILMVFLRLFEWNIA